MRLLVLLTLTACLAWGAPAQAQGLLDTARRLLAENLARAKRQALPAPAPDERDDDWGGPTPSRGLRPEQRADERQLDDRWRDERSRDERHGRPARSAPPTNEPPRRAAQRIDGPASRTTPAACLNVARAWDGAEAFARRGQTERAYEVYLRLLSTCTQPRELVGTAWKARTNLPLPLLEQLADEPVLGAAGMDESYFVLASGVAIARAEAGDTAVAARIARSLRDMATRFKDAAFLETGGWLELADGHPAAAETWFKAAMRFDNQRATAAEGLAQAYLAQNKYAQAKAVAARLQTDNAPALQAQVRLAQAADALARKQPKVALALLADMDDLPAEDAARAREVRAWALLSLNQNEEAAVLFGELSAASPDNVKLAEGHVEALRRLKRGAELELLAGQGGPGATLAAHAHAQLVEASGRRLQAARMRGDYVEGYGTAVTAMAGTRSKSGERGEGRLTVTTTPQAHARATFGRTTVAVDATRVAASDGLRSVRGNAYGMTVTREGRLSTALRIHGLALGATTRSGLSGTVRRYDNGGYLEGGLAMEPVGDSLRALVGVTENGTLTGKAMRYSLHAAGSHALGSMGDVQWHARVGAITGEAINSNAFYELRAGLPLTLQSSTFSWLSVGPELTLASYQEDHNRYAGAYGGYFSPRSDFGLGVRANAMTPEGRATLAKLTGYAGMSRRDFHYGSADGTALEGTAHWARLFGSSLIGQIGVSLRSAPDYSDVALWAGFTYSLERRTGLYASDLHGFRFQ